MKIHEILDRQITNLKTSSKPISDIWPNQTVAGIGAQSIAYLHARYPDKIIKTIQVSGTADPSYQFLRLSLNHQDNPFFPKIYNVKYHPGTHPTAAKQRDDDFDIAYDDTPPDKLQNTIVVVMEKLKPLLSISDADMMQFGLANLTAHIPSGATANNVKFTRAFRDPKWRASMQAHVSNQYLKQALRLLEPLFRHYHPDMHRNNIMLRGNQWVFIDPITNMYDDEDD
jgi:hypothetical protein